jgi:hypothetical protein
VKGSTAIDFLLIAAFGFGVSAAFGVCAAMACDGSL